MEELNKLKLLIPHFIEHGEEHIKSYKNWAEKLAKLGKVDEAARFEKAAELCNKAMEELKKVSL